MIKYSLICKDCSTEFESWFSSSKDFDRLKKLKFLNCKSCESLNIEKSMMSPNLANSKKKSSEFNVEKLKDVKRKLKDYQKFIKQNFEFVGENFTYEARSIHYNKKKTKKGIYGNASLNDVKELKEEGIETEVIPWVNDNDN